MSTKVRTTALSVAALIAALAIESVSSSVFAQTDASPIKIGFTTTQSGPLAPLVAPTLLARQMWAEDVNAKGGILGRKVELVFADDKYNSGLVGTLYSKLIDVDKVDLLMGGFGTAVTTPILPVMAQRNKLLFGFWNTTVNAQLHYDKFFNMAPWGVTPEGFQGMYALLAAKQGHKRIALLSVNIEGPQVMTEQVRSVSEKAGLTVVYDQKFPPGTTEFSSLLRAMNSARPDVIYVSATPADSIAIINQLAEIGVADSVKMCCGGMVGLQIASVLQRVGSKVNGLVNFAVYVPAKSMQFDGTADFFNRYNDRAKAAGIDPLGYYGASFAYAQGQVFQQAIEATKSVDDAKVAEHMHKAEFNTIVGKIKFDSDGEWVSSGVVQIQFQGIDESNNLEQFRKPESQVVVAPDSRVSGQIVPFGQGKK